MAKKPSKASKKSAKTPTKKQAKKTAYPLQPPIMTGLKGRCPRCGEGKLFSGMIAPADSCNHCQLDLSFAEKGDGPAVLVILVMGFVLTVLALYLFYTFNLSYVALAVILIPTTIIACVLGLRWTKGVMIAFQYLTGAEEGRLDK